MQKSGRAVGIETYLMNVVAFEGNGWVMALQSSLSYTLKKRSYQPQELV